MLDVGVSCDLMSQSNVIPRLYDGNSHRVIATGMLLLYKIGHDKGIKYFDHHGDGSEMMMLKHQGWHPIIGSSLLGR